MNKSKKVAATMLVAASLVMIPVAEARAADYTDSVYVTGDGTNTARRSNGKVVIKDGTWGQRDLWPWQWSYGTFGWKDVDYFWVPGGCDAYSQYGYKYVGNNWYGPLPNVSGTYLSLQVVC